MFCLVLLCQGTSNQQFSLTWWPHYRRTGGRVLLKGTRTTKGEIGVATLLSPMEAEDVLAAGCVLYRVPAVLQVEVCRHRLRVD